MWKVFEDRGGEPEFLYHRLALSRRVDLDHWLHAESVWAKEGSNPYYWTGFHVYPSLDAVRKWVHRTHRQTGRVVVEVDAGIVTKKPTRGEAYLAQRMRLTAAQWSARLPLESLKS